MASLTVLYPGLLYIFSVLTHYAIIPAFYVFAQYTYYYALEMVIVAVGILVSLDYHICQLLVNYTQCIFSLDQSRFNDHITAEATMLVVGWIYTKIPRVWMRWMFLLISLFILMAYKQLTDTPYLSGVIVVSCFVYGSLTQVYNPKPLIAGLSSALIGMTLYFIEGYIVHQEIVHGLWHIFIYASVPLVVYATWNNRNDPKSEKDMVSVIEAIRMVSGRNRVPYGPQL